MWTRLNCRVVSRLIKWSSTISSGSPTVAALSSPIRTITTPLARVQIGLFSSTATQFRTITKDTNSYRTLTLSADGKALATVQQKVTRTLYLLPATGFSGIPPNPASAQLRDAFIFNWAENGDLYFADGGNLVRISRDGLARRRFLATPLL